MISFDVNSLFTSTPLDQTIKLILSQVYQEKKIKTSIPKNILREIFRSTPRGVPRKTYPENM